MSDVLEFLAAKKHPKAKVEVEVNRELTEKELELLITPATVRVVARAPLERIKELHHVQARLLAEGRTISQVAAIVGSSVATLRSLLLDPMFQELVGYYRDQVTIKYLDVHEKLALALGMAVEELMKRLEDNPGGFSENQLRLLVETLGDRSVAPSKVGMMAPAAATQVFTINFAKPEGAVGQTLDMTLGSDA